MQHLLPNEIDMSVGHVRVVALNVQFYNALATVQKVLSCVRVYTAFGNCPEEKVWQFHWAKQPIQNFFLDPLQLLRGIVYVANFSCLH
jgi:hypothetical protein